MARWDLAMDLARPPLGVEQTFVADGDDGEYVYMKVHGRAPWRLGEGV